MKRKLVMVISTVVLGSFLTFSYSGINETYAQDNNGVNSAQLNKMISDAEKKLTPAQKKKVEEARKKSSKCLARALVAAGFGAVGGAGGSAAALMSELTLCHID
ncbi:TPA: hypothetical protein RJQ35_002086 [Staphylococcus pseudintermedius]|nr:hypothetical protein [Staphylococcus pseudintermedius]